MFCHVFGKGWSFYDFSRPFLHGGFFPPWLISPPVWGVSAVWLTLTRQNVGSVWSGTRWKRNSNWRYTLQWSHTIFVPFHTR